MWQTGNQAGMNEVGAPGADRTRDPLLRRQLLYPTELRAQYLNADPAEAFSQSANNGAYYACVASGGKRV